ncbi:ATP-binding protein [Luteimonas sp. SDU82]
MYREAFEQADAGLALLAPDGRWLTANAALCGRVGRPAAELVGTRAHETLFDAEAIGRIGMALDDAASAGSFVMARGREPGWRITLVPLGGPSGALLLQLDADDGAQARAATERMQEYLGHGLSHDLRAPLRGIAGFAARLDESGAVSADGQSDLARIRAAAQRAERLVDGVLELLRAGRQPLRVDTVDVSLLCDWVGGELRDAHPARAARIEVAQDLFALGDEHWLKTMLGHLLHNAWKFSATRDCVEIRIEGTVTADRLQLSVHDGGCGFDMRYADKLFVPFQRLHGTEQGGGNGLGLAIAQQIAERHGGRLWGTSRPGEGSTFFIDLPAATGRDLDERHDA